MTTTARETASEDRTLGWGGRAPSKPRSRLTATRRRQIPHLVIGALLVVGCAIGGVVAGLSFGDRGSALALARPVVVGQILSEQDLRRVDLPTDTVLDTLPASSANSVVGLPVAYDLPSGTLLTRAALGSPRTPPSGRAIAAVGLKPGQFPPNLTAGTTVVVLSTSAEPTNRRSWTAVVTGIAARQNDNTAVVSLQLSEPDARLVASVPGGQLSVISVEGAR